MAWSNLHPFVSQLSTQEAKLFLTDKTLLLVTHIIKKLFIMRSVKLTRSLDELINTKCDVVNTDLNSF